MQIRHKRLVFDPWGRKIPWRSTWQPVQVFLPGKSHGQRSLVGYSLWGCKESDMTEWLNKTQINTFNLSQVPQDPSFSPGGRPGEFLQISALQPSWCTWDARLLYSRSCSIHHSPVQTVPPPPGSSPALCHTLPALLALSFIMPLSTSYHQNWNPV